MRDIIDMLDQFLYLRDVIEMREELLGYVQDEWVHETVDGLITQLIEEIRKDIEEGKTFQTKEPKDYLKILEEMQRETYLGGASSCSSCYDE